MEQSRVGFFCGIIQVGEWSLSSLLFCGEVKVTLERVSSTCVRAPRMLGEKVESSWGGWLYLEIPKCPEMP